MQYQVIENMQKFSEYGLQMAKQVQAVQIRLWDELTGRQLEAAALWFDAGIKQLRLLSEIQSPHEIYAGQTQLAQECLERASEYARQNLIALTGIQYEFGAQVAPHVMPVVAPVSEAPKPAAPKAVSKPTPSPDMSEV